MSQFAAPPWFPRERASGERLRYGSAAASLLLHLAVLLAITWAPRTAPPAELTIVPAELVEEGGSAGSGGGLAAGAGGEPGSGAEATQRPAEPSAETKQRSAAARPSAPPPKPRQKPAVAQPRPPVPAPRPESRAAEAEQPAAQSRQAQAPWAESAQGGAASSGGSSGEAAAGRGAPGTGSGGGIGDLEGPGDEYLERLRRWLAKHKKYPAEARKRKQEGNVVVEFVLARDGAVLEAQIERSSGFPLIDQAVLDMLERASPAPPVPPAYRGERLKIAMPVRFTLGFFERLR